MASEGTLYCLHFLTLCFSTFPVNGEEYFDDSVGGTGKSKQSGKVTEHEKLIKSHVISHGTLPFLPQNLCLFFFQSQ